VQKCGVDLLQTVFRLTLNQPPCVHPSNDDAAS